jgi:hypothetical protein
MASRKNKVRKNLKITFDVLSSMIKLIVAILKLVAVLI